MGDKCIILHRQTARAKMPEVNSLTTLLVEILAPRRLRALIGRSELAAPEYLIIICSPKIVTYKIEITCVKASVKASEAATTSAIIFSDGGGATCLSDRAEEGESLPTPFPSAEVQGI